MLTSSCPSATKHVFTALAAILKTTNIFAVFLAPFLCTAGKCLRKPVVIRHSKNFIEN
jgi:hypothetical protein